jgi:hypothetical protein
MAGARGRRSSRRSGPEGPGTPTPGPGGSPGKREPTRRQPSSSRRSHAHERSNLRQDTLTARGIPVRDAEAARQGKRRGADWRRATLLPRSFLWRWRLVDRLTRTIPRSRILGCRPASPEGLDSHRFIVVVISRVFRLEPRYLYTAKSPHLRVLHKASSGVFYRGGLSRRRRLVSDGSGAGGADFVSRPAVPGSPFLPD